MATKAERFKREQQVRANPPKSKKPKPKRRDFPVDTAKPGVSATDRKVGLGNTARRNLTSPAKSLGGPALEGSATGKPSRKSTRASAGRVKLATNLTRRQKSKVSSPQARAARARVR